MSLLDPQPIPPSVLSDADYVTAANMLGCEIGVIKAVAQIESSGAPFDDKGRPTILFEPAVFSRLTEHQYDVLYPGITSGMYGSNLQQYPKLSAAYAIAPDAALKSASWGLFQLMGFNFTAGGFTSVEAMVTSMRSGVAAHLNAFVNFIQANGNLSTSIVNKGWDD